MKYLKNSEKFRESLLSKTESKKEEMLIENVNYHRTSVKNIGEIILPDPNTGDFKLSVMPFENTGGWVSLPEGFKQWEESFNEVLKHIPLQEGANTHYVTIDTKFFTTDEFLRREGVHIDGNFCVDPYFSSSITEKASWGGAEPRPSWGGARYEEPKSSWGGAEPRPRPSWGGGAEPRPRPSWGGARYEEPKSSWGGAEPRPRPSWGGARYEDPKSSWGGAEPRPRPSCGGARYEYELAEFESLSYPKYSLIKGENNIYSLVRESQFETQPDNSHVKMDWVLPYNVVIPISEYVSSSKGGILTVSTEVGCQAWTGDFYGEVMSEGSFEKMEDQLTDDRKVVFEKNQLYFMSSNTPHETLLISKGKRRTFLRITLNHNYNNEVFKEI